MKTISGNSKTIACGLILFLLFCNLDGHGQKSSKATGILMESETGKPVPFAHIALYQAADSCLINGTTSNDEGAFRLETLAADTYFLRISAVGFETTSKTMEVKKHQENVELGVIPLNRKVIRLQEAMVVANRIKGKKESSKTTYFINKSMIRSSNTGFDILTHIPGVQTDFFQNISLEGKENIQIRVNGREHNAAFLRQLKADDIDKIEIINSPGARYDSETGGVIHIILKEKSTSGISGHIYGEIPSSGSEQYLFPAAGMRLTTPKWNFFSSFQGEISNFNITERLVRQYERKPEDGTLISNQQVRQKSWSHRFHLGADYLGTENTRLSLYGFFNPASWEHNGNAAVQKQTENIRETIWTAQKMDSDFIRNTYLSVFFSHHFDNTSRKLTLEISGSNYQGNNSTRYLAPDSAETSHNISNIKKPVEKSVQCLLDFNTPLGNHGYLTGGIRLNARKIADTGASAFSATERKGALFGTTGYRKGRLDLRLGLRSEYFSRPGKSPNQTRFYLLPHTTLLFELTPKSKLTFSQRHSVIQPNIVQLNPVGSRQDPFSLEWGNPELTPEFHRDIRLEYSFRKKNNFLSASLFHHATSEAIQQATFINKDNLFETGTYNLGNIRQWGFQFSGAIQLTPKVSLNPLFRLMTVQTRGSDMAKQLQIPCKKKIAFQSGLSATASFKHAISASLLFQYNSPTVMIQQTSFSDPKTFLSINKTWNKKFKTGIKWGIPFSKTFTYDGNRSEGTNFQKHYKGIIHLSKPLAMVTFSYQFSKGKQRKELERRKKTIPEIPQKGF